MITTPSTITFRNPHYERDDSRQWHYTLIYSIHGKAINASLLSIRNFIPSVYDLKNRFTHVLLQSLQNRKRISGIS